jgi:hypothetical protein
MNSKNELLSKYALEHYMNLMISINSALWDLEGLKRTNLKRQDTDYVEVAELITQLNDIRHFAKKKIDDFFDSEITEHKSHKF